MSDDTSKLDQAASLELLDQLWGPPVDSASQRQAEAWARRSLGLPAEPGDAELLELVDADLASSYGLRRAS